MLVHHDSTKAIKVKLKGQDHLGQSLRHSMKSSFLAI